MPRTRSASSYTREGQAVRVANHEPALEPLCLSDVLTMKAGGAENAVVECLMCLRLFDVDTQKNDLFKHMVEAHQLVIGDTKLIADLKSYIKYWKQRFSEGKIKDYCTVIKINSKESDIGPRDDYYLLCDSLPEDRALREGLQRQLLVRVLSCQQREREDNAFSRKCLFCLEPFIGNRCRLFNHMNKEHNFNVGHPDNLVFVGEFLDLMHEKLESLQCLYCEKTFKDRGMLKEHMRKKQHRKLDSGNHVYDKFYVINYLELGKNWETILDNDEDDEENSCKYGEDDEVTEEDRTVIEEGSMLSASATDTPYSGHHLSDRYCGLLSDWTDWQEDEVVAMDDVSADRCSVGAAALCLFCRYASRNAEAVFIHMKSAHQFLLKTMPDGSKLNFYQQVKLINYIRRQIHQNTCTCCHIKFDDRDSLLSHMSQSNQFPLPEASLWDQPQYYFPTFEDDALLLRLHDDDDEAGQGETEVVSGQVSVEDLPSSLDHLQFGDELVARLQ